MTRRVLFTVNHAGFFLTHRLPLALAAQRAGYDVHVATPRSKHVPRIEGAGLPWHPLLLSRSGLNPFSEAAAIYGMSRLYRRLRPDLVHHVTSKPVLYGTPVARRLGIRAVVNAISGMGHVFAGGGSLLRAGISWGYHFSLRHPNMRVVFQNDHDRDMFIERKWVRPDDAILIPGSGVDTDVFLPVRRSNGIATVLFPSRMLTTKGLLEFVAAARKLREQQVNARFVLVGDSDPENPASVTEQQLLAWSESGAVEYWGRRDDMPAVFAQADIVCLPSYWEGMSKSLLEGAACGLPIVTTDVPGCRDVATHLKNGLLVPARSVDELAVALRMLIEDPSLRAAMGRAGRQRALEEFALPKITGAFLATYAELLA